jgi:hypothetical protein
VIGALSCDSCARERDGAPDKADWLITVRLGVLAETVCPACQAGVELEISEHAIIRFHERVRPTLSIEQAEQELIRQLEHHAHWAQPDWLSPEELGDDEWLMIGDSIGFAVRGRFIVSCFVRATLNPRGRRLATDASGWARRVRRSKEDPARRKAQGRAAKRNRKRDKSWMEEAS